MKKFKIGYTKTDLNKKGEKFDKYSKVEIEGQEMTTDRDGNLIIKKDNKSIAIFNRHIWLKGMEKK